MSELRERLRVILADNIPLTPYAIPTMLDKILALIEPQWTKVGNPPRRNKEVLGALKGCDSGKIIYRPIEYVNKDDHEWESEGCEVANCWDVIGWLDYSALPTPPREGE